MPADGRYYELLGVRPEASPAELRRAYETALARASREGATRHMVELVAAYEALADPARRRLYDQTGLSVPRERVPNTHGRATPWRGGSLGLGHATRRHVAPARSVVPSRRRRRPSRVLLGVLAIACAAGRGAAGEERATSGPAGT
ncbi:MAG: J domain-containing protein [Blastococcus sp.]